MGIETLQSPQREIIPTLKKPLIKTLFGPVLESVKASSFDQQLTNPEVASSVTLITNPRVTELKIPPAALSEPELKNLHPAQEVEGQLFVCDVRLYRNLYNEYLEFSNGDIEMARRNVLLAAIKDGTSLVQENISALKDKKGKLIVDDSLIQAKMQQTPTVHSFFQVTSHETNKHVITSPEYAKLGKSISTALTGWRRGNDKAVVALVEELAINLPDTEEGANYTLLWVSPKAEEWENEWIRKYNGEYGYQYAGHLTVEGGVRQLTVHSFKVDAKTKTYAHFMKGIGGEFYSAPFEEDLALAERPFLDKLMRSVTVVKGSIPDADVISGLYKSKKEIEAADRMFGILEGTMHFIQDPVLRQRIENEVSTPVAYWLVEQISNGVADNVIQGQIREKYINEVKAFVRRIKEEESKVENIQPQYVLSVYLNRGDSNFTSPDKISFMHDLMRRTQTAGGFCGDWGSSPSSSGLFSNPFQDLLNNYTGISGRQTNVFRAGSIPGEAAHCRKCGEETCESKCYKCKIDYKKAA